MTSHWQLLVPFILDGYITYTLNFQINIYPMVLSMSDVCGRIGWGPRNDSSAVPAGTAVCRVFKRKIPLQHLKLF
jgi:hypothetical protein